MRPSARAAYPSYYSQEEVFDGLRSNRLFSGNMRINKKDRQDAYVSVASLQRDVRIFSLRCRNRSLDGDLVAIEILRGRALEHVLEKVKEAQQKREADSFDRQRKCDPSYEQKESSEEKQDEYLYGQVVFVLEPRANQVISGMLSTDFGNNPNEMYKEGAMCWFKPLDRRTPFLAIQPDLVPQEYRQNPAQFESTIFTAIIHSWPETSTYPFGFVTGILGQVGQIPVETQAFLEDNGITWNEFDDDVMACLPSSDWTIPQTEIDSRFDLRDVRIFSIDPQTARDLDDALSVEKLGDNRYKVGVHIADVSYFVHPGTELDREAEHRATTVYLVQKAIPMLPRLLCEQLCSLNPGVERLAFSVFWVMDSEARILEPPVFGRSVIKSCAKLSYDHAQAFIEDIPLASTDLPEVQVTGGYSLDDVKEDVLVLFKMSLNMRQRRFDQGALTMPSHKLWFRLDQVGNPMACGPYPLKDSNRLVEEFMLLANMAVAKKICTSYPELSLLRRHADPQGRAMDQFIEQATSLGYDHFDPSTSLTLRKSFEKVQSAEHREILRHLCIRPMQRAKYFCSGLEDIVDYGHYSLACPLYTHFTSPIRRYCDVIVHRLLDCAINGKAPQKVMETLKLDTYRVGEIAKQCNLRKESAKNADDASQRLYLCVHLQKLSERGPLIEEAQVFKVGNRSLEVLIPRFSIEKRLYVEDLIDADKANGSQFDEEKGTLTVFWRTNTESSLEDRLGATSLEDGVDASGNPQTFKVFDVVLVEIQPILTRSPPDIKCILLNPRNHKRPKTTEISRDVDGTAFIVDDID